MSIEVVLVLFFAMILLGVPIAFSMIAISGLYFATGPIPSFVELLPQKMFEGIDFIILTAIPFFLLAGELMNRSGMAERLMHFANLVVGAVRGGFAVDPQFGSTSTVVREGIGGLSGQKLNAGDDLQVNPSEEVKALMVPKASRPSLAQAQ